MKEGIYIYPSKNEFLKTIDELIEFENSLTSQYIYLHKHFNDCIELDKEIILLNKSEIRAFNGFPKNNMIKVSLKLHDNFYNVSYTFNHKASTTYRKLYHYLRQREVISC